MLKASINDQDVGALLNCLSEIHELSAIDLVEWQELRFTLANIVGDLRTQFPNAPASSTGRFRKRVDLDDLLADKFKEWESKRMIHESGTESANYILEFHLSNSGRSTNSFVGSTDAASSVMSFKWALDHAKAWEQYEVQLCASTIDEIENLTLADMAHSLVLCAYN